MHKTFTQRLKRQGKHMIRACQAIRRNLLITPLLLLALPVAAQDMDHSHTPIAVPDTALPPALSLKIVKDAISGYNLTLLSDSFTLIPPPDYAQGKNDESAMKNMMASGACTDDAQGSQLTGHAHLYVNSVKIQRLYASVAHIPDSALQPGINQISVSINNHCHRYWTYQDKPIIATLFITPADTQLIKHRFESFPVSSPH